MSHPIAAALRDWNRVECPSGHTNLNDNRGETAYCKSCQQSYRYAELVDRATVPISERSTR